MSEHSVGIVLRDSLEQLGLAITPQQMREVLRDNAAALAADLAEVFWVTMKDHPTANRLTFDAATLSLLERLDAALRQSFAAYGIRTCSEVEAVASIAEQSFRDRLATLRSNGGVEGCA
ncbi:hypothetical protein [Methylobacterium sp. V23]|uniref:hypothetical protein n=1 Tax=Methylobacterium sp. V23 TaxID=2044878 RepID=UPI000CDA2CBF|nr:hypothetical protein [Methylobacterium sp. V23]POR40506.1 hypothetical protein CRT23_23420 [Methylobacterium sp. V23]